MRAARKPLNVKRAADLDLAPSDLARFAARVTREQLFVPVKTGTCEIIAGADERAQASALVERLQAARLI
jgi:hypothetical protein